MEQKTQIHAEDGKQEILITREFELPVELLFRAHIDPDLVEQWRGTTVLKLESKPHGSYRFVTTDPKKNEHGFNGVIHEFVPNQKITRTFEMENTGLAIQLQFLEFEELTNDTSKLTIHMVFRSVADRDQVLQLPFAQGLNMAHNRLQEVVGKLK
ncbi:MAG: SRPBCC domain-containing protein [Candidatus Marinimicrobia bacterium]|nr:SRPBCC domain-containing protein [Candidatus Neomarinimicrobiota bacterium]MCF7829020.1 SRPBCC domain-containing protein [Candidatus Neomarinimicrobiota bacterium]MCF7881843.1 SRPBCC domain-containing protein [Candidatus Neomarinimicrobiota bacterium]